MIIAVVEWNTDKGTSPEVIVADTPEGARRAVVKWLTPFLPLEGRESDVNYITAEWTQENPLPDLNDPEAVTAWLEAFHEETTDAWLTLYSPASFEAIEAHYQDVRSR